MNVASRGRDAFLLLPPGVRRQVLHGLGRYAPWEPQFDFTPPPLLPGEHTGPPDFVGIGVQKCGTTWWHDLIATHPDVYSRPGIHKERHFFDRFGSRPFDDREVRGYHGWFPRGEGTVTGEWTPDYFSFPWAPELLQRAAPDTRLVLLLRDPVERFRSGLAHQERMVGRIDVTTVNDAVQRGFYARYLDAWLHHVDEDRLLVLQYERCATDPVAQLRATFAFLGLDDTAPLPTGAVLETARPSNGAPGDDVTRRLVGLYEDDVSQLATRVPAIDLSLWPNFSHLAGGSPGL